MSQTSAHDIFLLMPKIKMVLCPHDALLQEAQGLSGCVTSCKHFQGSGRDGYMLPRSLLGADCRGPMSHCSQLTHNNPSPGHCS